VKILLSVFKKHYFINHTNASSSISGAVVVVSLFRLVDKFLKQRPWHAIAWIVRGFLGKIPES
jgi:F0F1-type ATP synthase assembly protein I